MSLNGNLQNLQELNGQAHNKPSFCFTEKDYLRCTLYALSFSLLSIVTSINTILYATKLIHLHHNSVHLTITETIMGQNM